MSEMLERTLYRTEAKDHMIFYSSSRVFDSQTEGIVMTHTGEYAEDDQSLTPIDLRRSTEYCII